MGDGEVGQWQSRAVRVMWREVDLETSKYAGCEKEQMSMVIMWMSTGQWDGVEQSGA